MTPESLLDANRIATQCNRSPHCRPAYRGTPCRSMSRIPRIAGIPSGTMWPGYGLPVARLEASTTRSANGAIAIRPAAFSSERPQLDRGKPTMPARPCGPHNSASLTQVSPYEPGDFAHPMGCRYPTDRYSTKSPEISQLNHRAATANIPDEACSSVRTRCRPSLAPLRRTRKGSEQSYPAASISTMGPGGLYNSAYRQAAPRTRVSCRLRMLRLPKPAA